MQCLNCGGPLEWAPNQSGARCTRCFATFNYNGSQLLPAAPPPGGMGGPPQPQQPQHNVAAGTFDMGGGAQLRVKINGKTPENYLKDRASSMIWGWIIGAVIIGIMVVVGAGFGIYVWYQAKNATSAAAAGGPAAAAAAAAAQWDGKSDFSCGGNDAVAIAGVTAVPGVSVHASGNCQLTLANVTLSAPVAIDASGNAKVNVTGGTVTGTTASAVAGGNAKVLFVGTKVTGKSKSSANGKVTGAP